MAAAGEASQSCRALCGPGSQRVDTTRARAGTRTRAPTHPQRLQRKGREDQRVDAAGVERRAGQLRGAQQRGQRACGACRRAAAGVRVGVAAALLAGLQARARTGKEETVEGPSVRSG